MSEPTKRNTVIDFAKGLAIVLMLADHIKEMIKEQTVNQTSEFQCFVATFMYADLKAKDYMKYLK